jgi:hypothetical protein
MWAGAPTSAHVTVTSYTSRDGSDLNQTGCPLILFRLASGYTLAQFFPDRIGVKIKFSGWAAGISFFSCIQGPFASATFDHRTLGSVESRITHRICPERHSRCYSHLWKGRQTARIVQILHS